MQAASEHMQDNPLNDWRPLLGDISREILMHESPRSPGHMSHIPCEIPASCPSCGTGAPALFRCRDCFCTGLECKICTVARHRALPFHRVDVCCGDREDVVAESPQEWTGTFFKRATLSALGLTICVSHPGCPSSRFVEFVIIDTTGVHEISVGFCGCYNAPDLFIQLLRAKLFPATSRQPQTAFTFSLLELFQILNLEARTSAFDFVHALRRMTDATQPDSVKVSFSVCVATHPSI